MKAQDLTGKRFGRLTAVEIASRKPIKWKCICDCGNERFITVSALNHKTNPRKSCGCLQLSDIIVSVGSVFKSKSCGDMKVIELLPKNKAICEFDDGSTIITATGNIRTGNVWNPFQPSTYGVGYFGEGKFKAFGSKAHEYWSKMMQRAYCPVYKELHKTYETVTVCKEWHNYQNFAEWCTNRKQYGKFGFNLDKDLKVRGNKVYSPETCSLVPQHINKVTVSKSKKRDIPQGVVMEGFKYVARCRSSVGLETYLGIFYTPEEASQAYKTFKKKTIIETANRYKDDLDEDVYLALLNFEVL